MSEVSGAAVNDEHREQLNEWQRQMKYHEVEKSEDFYADVMREKIAKEEIR